MGDPPRMTSQPFFFVPEALDFSKQAARQEDERVIKSYIMGNHRDRLQAYYQALAKRRHRRKGNKP